MTSIKEDVCNIEHNAAELYAGEQLEILILKLDNVISSVLLALENENKMIFA